MCLSRLNLVFNIIIHVNLPRIQNACACCFELKVLFKRQTQAILGAVLSIAFIDAKNEAISCATCAGLRMLE